ncbi:hypothetical protein [Cytobacillus purgationiresistens]|uniref:DUF1700 domain-containing protein n=1 Tax=Cytobacillus purgationiresistens TaxID=863449 RepID=A0ABU0AAV6_9BACI|nr:hypothetical protein [Cytobacillus purgationiresistens]MDQ0268382.1 hypothetical protein [Cytobacillus purgationiresistens]
MTLKKETELKIQKYIKQNTNLVASDELTYFEKLALHTNEKWMEAKRTAAKFKWTSQKNKEAQEDLMSYMSDYIEDCIMNGFSEEDAFEKAKVTFAVENPNNPLLKSDAEWLHHFDPNVAEAIGLYYAASMFIGLTSGALLGVILQMVILEESIGVLFFIVTGIGFIAGLGFGLLKNAKISLNNR